MKRLLPLPKGGGFRKTLLRIVAITIVLTITTLSPLNVFADDYIDGVHDGLFWFRWTNGKGTVNYQNIDDNRYTVTWDSNGDKYANFTCGKGWQNGSRYRLINYEGEFSGGDKGFLAVYGWTELPAGSKFEVAEYYVVEKHGLDVPPGSNIQQLGTVESDGKLYKIYRTECYDRPWIKGETGSFYQYWSVRADNACTVLKRPNRSRSFNTVSKREQIKRLTTASGTVTFENHVKAWEKAGMETGDFSQYYQVMQTEGCGSKGYSTIRVSGTEDYGTPYTQTVTINARYRDDNGKEVYMYIDSANKMNPSSAAAPVNPTDKKAQYKMEVLYYEHIDYYHYTEWAPVVVLKSLRTGKYVTVRSSDSRVRADSDSISTAQKFHYFNIRGDCSLVSLYNGMSLCKTGRCSGDGPFADGTFSISEVH